MGAARGAAPGVRSAAHSTGAKAASPREGGRAHPAARRAARAPTRCRRGGPGVGPARVQWVVAGRKYSTRSIERILNSLMSMPWSTRSGISVPAAPRSQTRR